MGLFSLIAKAGIAKKVFDEARKPENQQKVKDAAARVRGRGGQTRR